MTPAWRRAAQPGKRREAEASVTLTWSVGTESLPAPSLVLDTNTQATVVINSATQDNDGINLRDRVVSAASHQGTGLAGRRSRDGVQAHRSGPAPLASGERTHLVPPARAGARFEKGKLVERPYPEGG